MKLRDYQEKLIGEVRSQFRTGIQRPCIVAPCGSGKTVIMAWMAAQTAHNGKRVWFLVHRQELIDQSAATFHAMNIRFGIIGTGVGVMERIQIGSIFTVARRLKKLQPPDLIIFDEAHHSLATTWKNIVKAFPKAYCIGLTATPIRLNGDGLGDVFQSLIMGPSVAELIGQGNLANYTYYAPAVKADLSGLRMRSGEFQREELIARMDKNEITGDALQHYHKFAEGKRAIIYCAGVEHSKHVAAAFQAADIPAAHIDGETPSNDRKRIIEDFRKGELRILSNVDLISEGFDVPAMEAVIMLRPTASMGLYIQQAMRAMRPDKENPGKVALILDHVGNVQRHGLPDQDRVWSLEKKPRRTQTAVSIRQCPKCYAVHAPAHRSCPACGYAYEVAEKTGPEQVDGSLNEITSEERKKRHVEIAKARTRRDFESIAIHRGYDMGWVNHQCRARRIR